MAPTPILAVGLALWLAHAARRVSGRPPGWPAWACMFGPPAAIGYCILCLFSAPSDENALLYSREQDIWLTNAAWCLAAWIFVLVVEPLLILAGYLVRRRLDGTAHPHRSE